MIGWTKNWRELNKPIVETALLSFSGFTFISEVEIKTSFVQNTVSIQWEVEKRREVVSDSTSGLLEVLLFFCRSRSD